MRKYLSRKFGKGSFARHVIDLMTGAVVAQGILALSSPVLTRIYSPEEFGLAALYISIVNIGSVIMCWRYELAVVLPEKEKDAGNLLVLAFLICTGMGGISIIAAILFRESLAGFLNNSSIAPWLIWVPFSLLLMGYYMILNYWYNRKKKFALISKSRIGVAISTVGVQLGAGTAFNSGVGGLIGGQIFGRFIGLLILFGRFVKNDLPGVIRSSEWSDIKVLAAKYRKYPLFSTWPAFIDTLTMSMPVFFITKFMGDQFLGFFALSLRVLQLPLTFIGASIGQVYFQELAREKDRTGDVAELIEKTFKRLLIMAIPFCLVLLFGAPFLFKAIFGDEWGRAGEMAQILAPAISLRFVTSPLTTVFGVLNRQEVAAMWQIGSFICTAASLYASLSFTHELAVIYALALNDLFIYIVYLILVLRISKAGFINALIRGFK